MRVAIAERQKTTIFRDYLSLAKPRTILPHFFTAAAAMFLAAHGLPPGSTLIFTLVGGGLVATAANALNCYFDRDLDRMMSRTCHRPLPAGRLRPPQALGFGVVTGFIGLLILSRLVGLAPAALAAGAMAYYILVYTLCLKRHTYWSIVIGSVAGAITPLVGWVAITNRIEPTPFLLFAIISFWTLPHFWALAIFRHNEYKMAGLGIMPPEHTGRWITISSFLLVSATLVLVPAAGLSPIYLGVAVLLGLAFLGLAARLQHKETPCLARYLYFYSVLYLVLLFGTMVIDRLEIFPV